MDPGMQPRSRGRSKGTVARSRGRGGNTEEIKQPEPSVKPKKVKRPSFETLISSQKGKGNWLGIRIVLKDFFKNGMPQVDPVVANKICKADQETVW
jgi:hypothetical protein